jgi:hypothetical protein
MLLARRPLHLPPGVTRATSRSAGLTRSKSWSETLNDPDNRDAPPKLDARQHAVRKFVPTAVHEGIEADVRFIQLESEPTS